MSPQIHHASCDNTPIATKTPVLPLPLLASQQNIRHHLLIIHSKEDWHLWHLTTRHVHPQRYPRLLPRRLFHLRTGLTHFTPPLPPARRRCPPGNAAPLATSAAPQTHSCSLSKIIGNCWRALPLDEKKIWEGKAKLAKTDHKIRYPEYRFKPVHNKHKNKAKKEKPQTTVEDERRCEEVAQLLLEGKKGDELAAAVRDLDSMRSPFDQHQPLFHAQPRQDSRARRSSSVPLSTEYYPHFPFATPTLTLPTAPFVSAGFQPEVNQFRNLGARRPSSAGPHLTRSWTIPGSNFTVPHTLERDDSPLPDVNTSIWDSSFRFNPTSPIFDNRARSSSSPSSSVSDLSFDPSMSPHEILASHHLFTTTPSTELDPFAWMSSSQVSSSPVSIEEMFKGPTDQSYPYPQANPITTTPSSTYSPSPLPPADIVPSTNGTEVFAPKPQSATSAVFPVDFELWSGPAMSTPPSFLNGGMDMSFGTDMGMGMAESTSFDVATQAFGAFGNATEGVPMVGVGVDTIGDFGMEMEYDAALAMF